MKHLSYIGFLLAGLAIGILFGRGQASSGAAGQETSEANPPRSRPLRADRRDISSPSAGLSLQTIRNAAPGTLPGLTRLSAETPDPVEKRRLVTECLASMTAANWREIVSTFGALTHETGRDFHEGWTLALFRSGQVAGGEAMDLYLTDGLSNKHQESWHTLYGWSSRDPRAALEWLRKTAAAGNPINGDFFAAVIAGAALTDPADGLRLLSDVPGPSRKDCAGHLVWNVVNHGGTAALDPILDYASTLDRADPDDAALAAHLFSQATESLLKHADHARSVDQACDVAARLIGYGQDPTEITRATLAKYRWYYMEDKLRIVETIRSSPGATAIDLSNAVSYLIGTMNHGNGDAATIREWISRHPGSALVPHLESKLPAAQP